MKAKEVDKKLRHQLKIEKVREMKNPTILMNKTDFEKFTKEVEAKVNIFKVGDNPTYEDLPIKTKSFIKQGDIIIYDDYRYWFYVQNEIQVL